MLDENLPHVLSFGHLDKDSSESAKLPDSGSRDTETNY
jgi:hypothetical protein